MNIETEDSTAKIENASKIIEEIDESSDSDIKKPFDPTKIDLTVKPLIIDSLLKRMRSQPSRIDLNTEFQRRGNLWNYTFQSRLIESLLVRIPIPVFYFDGTDDSCWKVIDGLQRLTTLKNFVIDGSLKLQNLEFLKKFNGYGFEGLPAYLKTRIEETQITVYIINPGTPEDVKYNIFKRINTGGMVLKPQEIRHALNQGLPADFVKELAELKEFKMATHSYLVGSKRMEDRDFVTRFIAFYDGYADYSSDLDEYMNSAMLRLEGFSQDKLEKIKSDFIKAMKAAHDIFGEYAFRKRVLENDWKKPLNKALFDSISVNLARLSEKELSILSIRKGLLIQKFIELNKLNDFESAITTGTGKITAVKKRFFEIERILKECLNAQTN